MAGYNTTGDCRAVVEGKSVTGGELATSKRKSATL